MIRNKNLFQVDCGLIQFKYNFTVNKGSFVIEVLDFKWIKAQKWRNRVNELSKRNQGSECRGNIELLKVKGMKPIWTLYHKQRKNLCKLVGKHSGQQVVNTHFEEYTEVFKKVFSVLKIEWSAKWATLDVRKHTGRVRISEIQSELYLGKKTWDSKQKAGFV